MSDSTGPSVRAELAEFAQLMELRLQASSDRPTRSFDREHILSRMFEEVCDLRESLRAGRPILPDTLDLALLAFRLTAASGQLSNVEAARKDSLRVRDAAHDPVKESSGKYAFKLGDRWTMYGAELTSDEPVTDEMLDRTAPAIMEAMRSLHVYNVKVGRIDVRDGRVRVYPEAGVRDPRSVEMEAVILPTIRPPKIP